MKKVRLTKEQADAIGEVLDQEDVKSYEDVVIEWFHGSLRPSLTTMKLNDLIRALYIGYEVEQTPEEKIKELYDNHCHQGFKDQYANGVLDTIKIMLKHLNIKIEGVND